jgi:hypothetical protein
MAKKTIVRPTGNGTEQRIPVVEYHVVPNGARWDVERDDQYTGSFSYDVHTAVGLATAAAQRDLSSGLEATVCVQEKKGHCRHVWP